MLPRAGEGGGQGSRGAPPLTSGSVSLSGVASATSRSTGAPSSSAHQRSASRTRALSAEPIGLMSAAEQSYLSLYPRLCSSELAEPSTRSVP